MKTRMAAMVAMMLVTITLAALTIALFIIRHVVTIAIARVVAGAIAFVSMQ